MTIQSLSIVVPSKECINKCPFCVSRMVNSNIYPNLMDIGHEHYDLNVIEYMKRLQYTADCGCKTLMLTGTSEPQQNKQFLNTFALLHRILGKPFSNIEMQTTGMLLHDRNYLRFLRNFVGVNTIALSISSPDPSANAEIIGHPIVHPYDSDYEAKKHNQFVDFTKLVDLLKEYDFNIRLCFNLSSYFKLENVDGFFRWCSSSLHADQITFRKLYATEASNAQNTWIEEHAISKETVDALAKHLLKHPVAGRTVYGAEIRHINGMSVIFDDDCMGKKPKLDNTLKYLILRPNCKLYSSWDTPASLVF